jgi:hypothetical protein
MKNRNFFLVLKALVVAAAATGCATTPSKPPKAAGSDPNVEYPSGGGPGGPASVIWPAVPPAFPPSPQSPTGELPTFKVNDSTGKRPIREGETITVSATGMVFFSRSDMDTNCYNVRVLNLLAKQEAGVCLVFLAPHLQGLKVGEYLASWKVGEEKVGFRVKVVPGNEAKVVYTPPGAFATIPTK